MIIEIKLPKSNKAPCFHCKYRKRDKNKCLDLGCTLPGRYAAQQYNAAFKTYAEYDITHRKPAEIQPSAHTEKISFIS